MFYSDDPARDWERYCDYQDKLKNDWKEENWMLIQDIEDLIKNINNTIEYIEKEKVKTKKQFIDLLNQVLNYEYYSYEHETTYKMEWDCDYEKETYKTFTAKERAKNLLKDLKFFKNDILKEYETYIKD